MSKLSVIAVTYGHSRDVLLHFITSLRIQTEPDWDCFIVHDGPSPETREIVESFNDPRLKYRESEHKGYWGHYNREWILESEELAEYVCWTNCDNSYFPIFVEFMVGTAKRDQADIVMNAIVHNYPNVMGNNEPAYSLLIGHPHLNRADFMSYIMKTELARKIGFTHKDFTGQDGLLVQYAAAVPGVKISRCPSIVGVHC